MKKSIAASILLSTFILLSGTAVIADQNIPSVEIGFTKHFSGFGIVPTLNEYVLYDVNIKNTSNIPITNQSLWVSFTSREGKTNVHTSFSIPGLLEGGKGLLHLGPFKMRETGEHDLFVGINGQGNSSMPNEVSFNYAASRPIDTIIVYDATLIQIVMPVALSLVIGGVTTVAVLFLHYKRKRTIR